MAVALDNTSSGQNGGSATTLTVSHVIGSGANRVLYAWVETFRSGGSLSPSSVTCNGTGMTLVGSQIYGTNSFEKLHLYRLINPPTGTVSIVVTASVAIEITLVADSYTGADQTTPEGTPVSSAGSSSTPSDTVTGTTSGNIVIDGVAIFNKTFTAGSGQTARAVINNGGGNDSMASSDKAAGGSVVMAWTLSGSGAWGHLAVEVNAAAGGVTASDPFIRRLPGNLRRR